MKPVDIRELNGRQYDMNGYTQEVRAEMEQLFAKYEEAVYQFHQIDFDAIWVLTDEDKLADYYTKRDKAFYLGKEIEEEISRLDKDPFSHKGITFSKISHYFRKMVSSKWYTLFFTFYFLYLAIDSFLKYGFYFLPILNLITAGALFNIFLQKKKNAKKDWAF